MSQTILVSGASGHLGSRVIHHLLETEKVAPSNIVAASRDPAKLSDLAAKGVITRKADFEDAASLDAAFAGIDRLVIISTDSLDTPGKRLAQHKVAIAAATRAGIKHVVYTSMPNPGDSLVTFAPDHLGTEQALKASGLSHTILRDAWYMDNYLMAMPHNLSTGQWFTASGDGRVANISRDDCARAIAAVLASEATTTATYTLTGSQSLNANDVAALVTAATEKALNVVAVSDEQLAGGLSGAGLPGFVVDMLVSADANIRAGKFDLVTTDFKTLTGRDPQTLKAFFEDNRTALIG